jgi:hypothetical protein
MKMEQIECSETSAYKIQTPGNYPEEDIQHIEHSQVWNQEHSSFKHQEEVHNSPVVDVKAYLIIKFVHYDNEEHEYFLMSFNPVRYSGYYIYNLLWN